MPLRVVGLAIISINGMIADANGQMPPAIVNPADQRFFADALDAAAIIVHGRNSHERQVNSPRRRRLVVTHRVAALMPHPEYPNAALWNPDGADLETACAAVRVDDGVVAVIGGTDIFSRFLPRYDVFQLTHAAQARIPDGRPVFYGIPPHTPEELLQQHGLHSTLSRVLDVQADVTLTEWLR